MKPKHIRNLVGAGVVVVSARQTIHEEEVMFEIPESNIWVLP